MLLQINDIEKHFGTRRIIRLKHFMLQAGDKVAVVGANGAGKTTLFRIISGAGEADGGQVALRGSVEMITQEDAGGQTECSGGEATKARIAAALVQRPDILLADEPTTNLDIAGIQALQRSLIRFSGGLMLISHDRDLLSAVCTSVLELDGGECRHYHCGYDEYVRQKAVERKTHKARYEQYTDERRRLKAAADGKARRSAAITGPPKRMGNSEARLHRMGGQRQKKALDKAAKAAKSRLKQLERVEKPYEKTPIVFDLRQVRKHNPVLARVNGASKAYGSRQVLRECRMTVPNEKRTALVGPNGCGKTTLMNMIASGAPGIETCAGLRIGYFTQDIQNVDGRMTVLENAMADTRYDHQFVRTILNRMLFGRAEVDKRAAVLSGGERIRLSLAKIILSPAHLLMLDEPTNYLDIPAREALEDVLRAYGGAVLITSHDRAFVRAVAHRIVALHDGQAKCYEGGWEEYTAAQDAQQH